MSVGAFGPCAVILLTMLRKPLYVNMTRSPLIDSLKGTFSSNCVSEEFCAADWCRVGRAGSSEGEAGSRDGSLVHIDVTTWRLSFFSCSSPSLRPF